MLVGREPALYGEYLKAADAGERALALAVSLSTSSYLATGRFVDSGTAALGILFLAAYRRRASTSSTSGKPD